VFLFLSWPCGVYLFPQSGLRAQNLGEKPRAVHSAPGLPGFAEGSLSLINARPSLQLWDIAGQERFSAMTRVYYKQAAACIIVFDVTKRSSFAEVFKWKADLDDKVRQPNGDPLPCLLLANKCDLPDRPVPAEEISEFVRTHGKSGAFFFLS
jgi:small GTP-binding protein